VASLLILCAGPARAGLDEQLKARISDYRNSSKALVALSVVDLQTGKTLSSLQQTRQMIPASNQKLVTSILALKRLGHDFTFKTSVYLYQGDLCLAGDADPTLGDPILARRDNQTIYDELDLWARTIGPKLPRRSFGDLVLYADPPAGTQWQHTDWSDGDKARWYGAPVGALNFHNNCYDVTFRIQAGKVLPDVTPASRFIQVTDQTRKGKRQIWLLRPEEDESKILLKGTVARASSEPISAPAKHPPLLLGRVLADRLARKNITMAGTIVHKTIPEKPLTGATWLAGTETPIAMALLRANKRSLNMAAECLFLRAGNGRWEDSARILSGCMKKDLGIPESQFVLSDGSGLSRNNRISAGAMTRLLADVLKTPGGKVLLESLPISGTDGSLDDRMEKAPYAGRVLAKTGYIYGVCCLSGYVLDARDRPALAFSILVNKVPGGKAYIAKRMQNDLCRAMVDHLDNR
jgi:D-alanyl-D-alanine carboxypeptidase/D-alanyl-D-alanine-endopeptidase (penicillin-binding protein 4)